MKWRLQPLVSLEYADADDFDPEAGFSKPGENKDAWEGEDEGLKIEEEEEEVKPKGEGEFAKPKMSPVSLS